MFLAQKYLRWLDKIAGGLAIIGGTAVVFLVGVTVVSVFFRYVVNDPIFGVTDVSRMSLAVIVAGSIAYGARQGGMVHVDILAKFGGRKITRLTDVFVRLGGIVIVALSSGALWEESRCGFDCGEFTDNLEISHVPFYWLLSIAMAVYTLMLVLEFIIGIANFNQEVDPNEHG